MYGSGCFSLSHCARPQRVVAAEYSFFSRQLCCSASRFDVVLLYFSPTLFFMQFLLPPAVRPPLLKLRFQCVGGSWRFCRSFSGQKRKKEKKKPNATTHRYLLCWWFLFIKSASLSRRGHISYLIFFLCARHTFPTQHCTFAPNLPVSSTAGEQVEGVASSSSLLLCFHSSPFSSFFFFFSLSLSLSLAHSSTSLFFTPFSPPYPPPPSPRLV